MAEKINFHAELRERTGKGGAREARRNGLVPAVLYGGGGDPVAINLKHNEVIRAINSGHFLTSTADLTHDGKKQLVIPQAIQLHPVTDMPLHVDLYRVKASQVISVEVPVHFENEEDAPGIKRGGTVNVVRHAVELNVRADSIPDYLIADVAGLDIGDTIKISDITLPAGAEPTITDRDFTIASIVGGITEEDEVGDEEEVEADEVEAINQSDEEDGEGDGEGASEEGDEESKD